MTRQAVFSFNKGYAKLLLSNFLMIMVTLIGLMLSGCLIYGDETDDNEELGIIRDEITFGGHDYLFVSTPKTWNEAQTYCAIYNNNLGYHLVTINSLNEESFLNTNESTRGLNSWWIGYSDAGLEGFWTWSSGSSAFTNWSSGQPDNLFDEDCAIDRFGGSDSWNDVPCTSTNVFICERDASALGSEGSFTYNKTNTNSATVNTAQRSVTLFAGQLFTMGTCGVPGATGSGDTFLRLLDPMGLEIANNDNSGSSCGKLSNLSIVIPNSGSYVIRAGCFGNTTCSGTVVYDF